MKTMSAAEQAINKLQSNTAAIEVGPRLLNDSLIYCDNLCKYVRAVGEVESSTSTPVSRE